jgi:pilus assembly protein Flp/PilA
MSTFRRFWDDDSGATSIEYSVIAAGVALAIVATVQILGVKVTSLFSTVLSGFN